MASDMSEEKSDLLSTLGAEVTILSLIPNANADIPPNQGLKAAALLHRGPQSFCEHRSKAGK